MASLRDKTKTYERGYEEKKSSAAADEYVMIH